MMDPIFLSRDFVLYIHQKEAERGNKRVAAAGAMAFLSINGFIVLESHELELAEKVLGYLDKPVSKQDLARYFRERAIADPGEAD